MDWNSLTDSEMLNVCIQKEYTGYEFETLLNHIKEIMFYVTEVQKIGKKINYNSTDKQQIHILLRKQESLLGKACNTLIELVSLM